ncbi:MAG: hypothetical protein ACM3L6_07860 [Deltaproteobacteria bacterium]
MNKRLILFRSGILVLGVVLTMSGCETLRRKFTRKKRRAAAQETMIVSPRDYSEHPFPNDTMYRQYFAYWKAWNQEWIASLADRDSHKKVLSCGDQTVANLEKMATYLKDEQRQELGGYVEQARALQGEIAKRASFLPSQYNGYRYRAERLFSAVNRRFDMRHMKDAIR